MSYIEITAALARACAATGLQIVPALSFTPAGRPGDLQCNSLLPVLTRLPQEQADQLLSSFTAALDLDERIASYCVTGKGFLNFTLTTPYLISLADEIGNDPECSAGVVVSRRIVLDFGGPNVAKKLHVGHLRSFVIGESLRRMLTAQGHEVTSDIHLGDWGLQMGKLLLGFEASGYSLDETGLKAVNDAAMDIDSLQDFYVKGNALCKPSDETEPFNPALERARKLTVRLQNGEPHLQALWAKFRQISMVEVDATISLFDAHFDLKLGESDAHADVQDIILDLTSQGKIVENEGALIIPTADQGSLLVQSMTGSVLYGGTDIAAAMSRVRDHGAQRLIYCVDHRQQDHLKKVAAACLETGLTGEATFEHAGFGTINGPDGRALKTRDGSPPALADLLSDVVAHVTDRMADDTDQATIKSVALAAIKYADLSSDRETSYNFDLDRMTSFEGKSGPYLQYAAVRIKSILAKAGDAVSEITEVSMPEERALLVMISRFPVLFDRSCRELKPHFIAEYSFDLAQAFSSFYAACPVLHDDRRIRGSRVTLCRVTLRVLEQCLYLLGIKAPDKM